MRRRSHHVLGHRRIEERLERDGWRRREGIAPLALRFTILTAARTGEVRGMLWQEVDSAICVNAG